MKAVDLPGHSARGGIGRIHGIFYCGAQGKQKVSAAAAFHGDGSSAVPRTVFLSAMAPERAGELGKNRFQRFVITAQ